MDPHPRSNTRDATRLVRAIVAEAAGGPGPLILEDHRLGSSEVVADLLIAGDELIAVIVAVPGDADDRTLARLHGACRYCDRVIAVVDEHQPSLLASIPARVATWVLAGGGRLEARRAGQPNRVALSAILDLLPPADRQRLLRPLVPTDGPYDRAGTRLPSDEPRATLQARLHAQA